MTTTADTGTALDRLQAALTDPDHLFTGEQVAYLMAEAHRWGREAAAEEPSAVMYAAGHTVGYADGYAAGHMDGYAARCAEDTAPWPPPPVFNAEKTLRSIGAVDRRRAATRDGARRRAEDYRGGPLEPWPATWCGDPAAHRPHPAVSGKGEDQARFRCEGRR